MDDLEKLLRGWHASVLRHRGRKPLYRASIMRTDEHWFEGSGMTARAAINRAVKAAGGSPTVKTKCERKGCVLCEGGE